MFFAEPQRGFAYPAGAQEGRQPAVFHPLVNLPFSLRGHGEICRAETRKGAVEDFFFRVFRNRFAVPDTGLLHRSATLRRVRHDSAAQFVSLETADGTYEDKLYWIL